ncbi:MAG: hypothetical protein JO215_00335, partial [Ktedonobacteraceae bacterium]|nr:hypothetical protein [Ktedonobacteraceae bacterium]
FITPWVGTETQLQGTDVQFATPWEGTGGQLHEVGARFTGPLALSSLEDDGVGARFTGPWVPSSSSTISLAMDDLSLQQTTPIPRMANLSGPQGGASPLRPYRLEHYQSRGVPVSLTRSASGTLRLRPAGSKERRTTADLAPASQKIVPGESSPALQSWERRRHMVYTWFVLLTLFLLVILGGICLDSLIASYR